MTSPTHQLADLGVSIWLDDLSRERLTSGSLASLMKSHCVVGVTSNPTIFAAALQASDNYRDTILSLKAQDATPEDAVFDIMIADVRDACDLLFPLYEQSGGGDGRVSLEVSPLLAADTAGTVAQAKDLWARVNRPNLMVKIPATLAGLPAITETIAAGISVNVTLIFSLNRYNDVMDAYFTGIEKAQKAGVDISRVFSVASFFVSRVDTAIDAELSAFATPEAIDLKSRAAVANARLAYELYAQKHSTERAIALLGEGMNRQRPLWASTGVKDPSLSPTLYVTELAVADVVNTMPEKTLLATEADGQVLGDRVTGLYSDAHQVMAELASAGIDIARVTEELERDGVAKFVQSWHDLLHTVEQVMSEG